MTNMVPFESVARQLVGEPPTNGTVVPISETIGSLAGALAQARDRCKPAEKGSVNTYHKYRYASADDVIAVASAALGGSGLGLMPLRSQLTTLGSGSSTIYALDRTLLLAHSSGEYTILTIQGWPVIPDKGRPLDKAYAIALTSSLSYLLRDLLQMPREDPTDDMSARDDRQATAAPAPPQPQPEPPPDPTPAPQVQGSLTEQEYEALLQLMRAHGRVRGEAKVWCQIMGVQALDRAPRSRLNWLMQVAATGLVSQSKVDRITQTLTDLGSDWAKIPDRLQAKYGVKSLGHLLPHQADELERTVKDALSKKLQAAKAQQQPQPA